MTEPTLSEKRGLSAANRPGAVLRVSEDECLVKSENGVKRYRVRRLDSEVWVCECQCYQSKHPMCRHSFAAKFFVKGTKEFQRNFSEPKPAWELTDPEYEVVDEVNRIIAVNNSDRGLRMALKFERNVDGKLAWVGFRYTGRFDDGCKTILEKFRSIAGSQRLIIETKMFLADSSRAE
jgi:hypothetical protein